MGDYIYFATIDGGLIDNYDVVKMAKVVHGKDFLASDFESVRGYAKTCKGIKKEINPSIKYLLEHNKKVKAIQIYRRKHEGMGLREAKEIVDKMEENLKKRAV